MKKNHLIWISVFISLCMAGLACASGTPTPDDAEVERIVLLTSLAHAEAQLTLDAADSPPATSEATLPATVAPSATSTIMEDVIAPVPLGPAWSSMAFSRDTCYDMDVLFTADDAAADFCLDGNVILTAVNGAVISGNATLTPPSMLDCRAADLRADPVAPNTDLYICFQTNAGSYGFFVMRADQMLSDGYIVFDAYVFS